MARLFGCVRTVYNDAVAARREARETGAPYPKFAELCRGLITQAKKTPEREWLSEVSVVPLHQAMRDVEKAYQAYFASQAGKRRGPRVGYPRFKSRKDGYSSARFTSASGWSIKEGKLSLPKIGLVKVRWSRDLPSAPSSVTVIKDAAGRYFASFVVQTDATEVLPTVSTEVGIDLGLTHFAVLSDGRKITSPKFLRKAERKLRKAQQALSRKQNGSNNRRKAAAKVARLHAHVADSRRDHHHKLSTQIIRENQAVYVESLGVRGLGRTRMAKSVHDAGWARFTAMLEYKATRYGRTCIRVHRLLPTSQTCHVCGVIDGPKGLSVRTWDCQACGTTHDRDVNAARVILAAGQAERLNACGASVRPGLVLAQRSEPGTCDESRDANGSPRVHASDVD